MWESRTSYTLVLHVMNALLGTHLGDRTYMQPMAELLAEQGFLVLIIGMHDDD